MILFFLINNGNGFDTVQNISNSYGMSRGIWDGGWRNLFPMDVNGDGLTDLLLQAKHGHHDSFLLINNGNGFDTAQNISNSYGMSRGIWDGTRNLFPMDVNGDGLTDLLLQAKHGHHDSFLLINNGNGFDTVQNISNSYGMSRGIWDGGWRNLFPMDVNGDGLTDLLLQAKHGHHDSFLLINNGNGFDTAQNISNSGDEQR